MKTEHLIILYFIGICLCMVAVSVGAVLQNWTATHAGYFAGMGLLIAGAVIMLWKLRK